MFLLILSVFGITYNEKILPSKNLILCQICTISVLQDLHDYHLPGVMLNFIIDTLFCKILFARHVLVSWHIAISTFCQAKTCYHSTLYHTLYTVSCQCYLQRRYISVFWQHKTTSQFVGEKWWIFVCFLFDSENFLSDSYVVWPANILLDMLFMSTTKVLYSCVFSYW